MVDWRGIAMVFQNYALYPHMNVFENIAFNLRISKMPKPQIKEAVMDAARILRLEGLLDRKPSQLSGGQRQRVAIGRAIVRKPTAVPRSVRQLLVSNQVLSPPVHKTRQSVQSTCQGLRNGATWNLKL